MYLTDNMELRVAETTMQRSVQRSQAWGMERPAVAGGEGEPGQRLTWFTLLKLS